MIYRVVNTKFITILFFFLISVMLPCQARVGVTIVTEFMPPLQLAKPGQQMHGLTADLVNAVVLDTKLNSTSHVFPWARSYLLATTKPNVLIYPIIRTTEREKSFHWVGPIWSFSAAIYSRIERNDIIVSSLEDAKKYNISVYRNDFFHRYLLEEDFSPSKLFPVANIEQSINLFINGRVDLLVIDTSIFEYYLKKHQRNAAEFKQLIKLTDVKKNDAFIALSKMSSPEVVDQFVKSYQRVANSDKLTDIRRFWAAKTD
jgi:polar amino acid transport system substrate-binding protein